MLPKSRRIQRGLYPESRPQKYNKGDYLSISVFPTASAEDPTKFSVTVSKKTAKKAVLRNKLRRWGYRIIQNLLPGVKEGFLIRFSIHNPKASLESIQADIED